MNDDALLRYSRQIMLPQIDVAGQEKLSQANVLIVGLGGLGSPSALYLAAAGVGHLLLADHDAVDLSNLQRQIIHRRQAINTPKVESAATTLTALSPETRLTLIDERLDASSLREAVAAADLVLDGTDNFTTRYAVNDVCFELGTPLVSAAAIGFEGQLAVFDPRDEASPCYRCLYPHGDDAALNCAENGVIAPLVGVLGTMQAMEAIKLLAGIGTPLTGYLMCFDALAADWKKLKLPRSPGCPVHARRR